MHWYRPWNTPSIFHAEIQKYLHISAICCSSSWQQWQLMALPISTHQGSRGSRAPGLASSLLLGPELRICGENASATSFVKPGTYQATMWVLQLRQCNMKQCTSWMTLSDSDICVLIMWTTTLLSHQNNTNLFWKCWAQTITVAGIEGKNREKLNLKLRFMPSLRPWGSTPPPSPIHSCVSIKSSIWKYLQFCL